VLQSTGNEQGGHYFLRLHSGKMQNRYVWMELPMPNEVIVQVNCLTIAAERYDRIVFNDADGNALSEIFTDDMDNKDNAENIILNNQQPPETEDIEEKAETDAGSVTSGGDMMPPEDDDMDKMTGNTENQDNTRRSN
jgi:hypothetical protein